MSRFLFVMGMLFSMNVGAQIHVKMHTHSWAGGVCCRTGTDITYTLNGTQEQWYGVDSLIFCQNGKRVVYALNSMSVAKKDSAYVYTIIFSHSYDRYNEGIERLENKEVYKPICSDGKLWIKGKGFERELSVNENTQSFTAYP